MMGGVSLNACCNTKGRNQLMPLPQCCRVIKHSGQGLGDVLQGYGWCWSCSRGLLAYLTNPISCSGAQVQLVPERFHVCGARCCWIFILCMWEVCLSIPDLWWDPEIPTGSTPKGSPAAAAGQAAEFAECTQGGWYFVCSLSAHCSGNLHGILFLEQGPYRQFHRSWGSFIAG